MNVDSRLLLPKGYTVAKEEGMKEDDPKEEGLVFPVTDKLASSPIGR